MLEVPGACLSFLYMWGGDWNRARGALGSLLPRPDWGSLLQEPLGAGGRYSGVEREGEKKKSTETKVTLASHYISPDSQWRIKEEKFKVPD